MERKPDTDSAQPENTPADIRSEIRRIFNGKIRNNRSVLVFLVSFVLVFLVWFLKQMQNGYVMSTSVSPEYVNLPSGYSSSDLSNQKIRVAVRMNGFNMLSYAVGHRRLEVDLNKVVRQSEGRHYWIPALHSDLIAGAILPSDKVEKIETDTIFLNMGDEMVKTVPLEPSKISVTFRPGYNSFGPTEVTPGKVRVFGTPDELSRIDRIILPELSYRNLSAPVADSVGIPLPSGMRRVRIEPASAFVSIRPVPYTEGEVQVNVRAVNLPAGRAVKFFPSKVTVRYRVAVEDYTRVAAEDLRVVADMRHASPGTRYVYPSVVAAPSFLGKITIVPEKVQYLYRQR